VGAGEVLGRLAGAARRNAWQKGFALVLAALLWWYVAGESKVQVGFAVPLEIRNVPPGTAVANKVERQVEVQLEGPPSLIGGLSRADVSAVADLGAARPGRQVVRLDARAVRVPPGIRVQRVYPSAVEVVLARIERRLVPVAPRIGGTPAQRRRILRVEVEPAAVEVEGIPEELDRLGRVPTEEIVPDPSAPVFAAAARLDLRGGHAKIVGDAVVRVRVHFRH